MARLRRSVRAIAIVWLVCQAASLSAFVPEICCLSHAEEAAAKKKAEACHEAEPPAPEPGDACPMQHHEGAACPMHRSNSKDCCSMSNACNGPGTHLTTLFSYVGTVERPATLPVLLTATAAFVATLSVPLVQDVTPDSPPPKA